jgi:hypothetical protein
MKPMQQSHTYRIQTMPPLDLKCGKSVPAPPHQKSNFHLSKNFQNTTHNRHKNNWTETAKTHTVQGLIIRDYIHSDLNKMYAEIFGESEKKWSYYLTNFLI